MKQTGHSLWRDGNPPWQASCILSQNLKHGLLSRISPIMTTPRLHVGVPTEKSLARAEAASDAISKGSSEYFLSSDCDPAFIVTAHRSILDFRANYCHVTTSPRSCCLRVHKQCMPSFWQNLHAHLYCQNARSEGLNTVCIEVALCIPHISLSSWSSPTGAFIAQTKV